MLSIDNLAQEAKALQSNNYRALTWNCEGLKNNIFKLTSVPLNNNVTFAFLSEPQLYQCDTASIFQYLEGDYCWSLNSHDILDPELPLIKSKAIGGTLMLWQRDLDPFIEVLSVNTTASLPVIFRMPGLMISVHISLYMPTHSKDSEFVSDLADLRNCLDGLMERFTKPIIYIRGDGNVNPKNSSRVILLQQLIRDYNLIKSDTGHNTYHHVVGDGLYDSDIDILLHISEQNVSEDICEIICKNDDPTILSHHDIILSNFSIPTQAIIQTRKLHDAAPRVDHTRTRVSWSEHGQQEYCELVAPHLRDVRDKWLDPSSQMSMSILLSVTNDILTKCATMTNEYKVVGTNHAAKSKRIPKAIKLATNKMIKAHRVYKKNNQAKEPSKAKEALVCSRKKYRQTVRQHRLKDSLQRYHKVDNIFSKPSAAYAYLRACKNTKPKKIEQLSVGGELYEGGEVCDGFYVSMNAIKQCSIDDLRDDTNLASQFVNYDNIIQLCKNKPPIPR